jgi:tetratricopeptide (TPR) repeat protein
VILINIKACYAAPCSECLAEPLSCSCLSEIEDQCYIYSVHELCQEAEMFLHARKVRSATVIDLIENLKGKVLEFIEKYPQKEFTRDFISNKKGLAGLYYKDILAYFDEYMELEKVIDKRDIQLTDYIKNGTVSNAMDIYKNSYFFMNKVFRGIKIAEYIFNKPEYTILLNKLVPEIESTAMLIDNLALRDTILADVGDLLFFLDKNEKALEIYKILFKRQEKINFSYLNYNIRMVDALYNKKMFKMAKEAFNKLYHKSLSAEPYVQGVVSSDLSRLFFKFDSKGLGIKYFRKALAFFDKNPKNLNKYERDYLAEIYNQNKILLKSLRSRTQNLIKHKLERSKFELRKLKSIYFSNYNWIYFSAFSIKNA